jgi:hypothetical protein
LSTTHRVAVETSIPFMQGIELCAENVISSLEIFGDRNAQDPTILDQFIHTPFVHRIPSALHNFEPSTRRRLLIAFSGYQVDIAGSNMGGINDIVLWGTMAVDQVKRRTSIYLTRFRRETGRSFSTNHILRHDILDGCIFGSWTCTSGSETSGIVAYTEELRMSCHCADKKRKHEGKDAAVLFIVQVAIPG